jgi:hypothetical protein
MSCAQFDDPRRTLAFAVRGDAASAVRDEKHKTSSILLFSGVAFVGLFAGVAIVAVSEGTGSRVMKSFFYSPANWIALTLFLNIAAILLVGVVVAITFEVYYNQWRWALEHVMGQIVIPSWQGYVQDAAMYDPGTVARWQLPVLNPTTQDIVLTTMNGGIKLGIVNLATFTLDGQASIPAEGLAFVSLLAIIRKTTDEALLPYRSINNETSLIQARPGMPEFDFDLRGEGSAQIPKTSRAATFTLSTKFSVPFNINCIGPSDKFKALTENEMRDKVTNSVIMGLEDRNRQDGPGYGIDWMATKVGGNIKTSFELSRAGVAFLLAALCTTLVFAINDVFRSLLGASHRRSGRNRSTACGRETFEDRDTQQDVRTVMSSASQDTRV